MEQFDTLVSTLLSFGFIFVEHLRTLVAVSGKNLAASIDLNTYRYLVVVFKVFLTVNGVTKEGKQIEC